MDQTLGTRELNRALLGRQFLLERVSTSALEAIDHLVDNIASAAPG